LHLSYVDNVKELCIALMIVIYYMYSSTIYHEVFCSGSVLSDNMVNQLTNIAVN